MGFFSKGDFIRMFLYANLCSKVQSNLGLVLLRNYTVEIQHGSCG